MEKPSVQNETNKPSQQEEVPYHRCGDGACRRIRCCYSGRAGLRRIEFLLPGQPKKSSQYTAQGGINASKNYQNDGDSVFRLFYDTIKGGDFRSRESNVYRLAEVSNQIIDQCVAQGVPFARDYGGLLANRSFGGAQVSRTFYARGQTGQQLLLGAYQAQMRQVNLGKIKLFPRTEMLDLVLIDGKARGIIARDLITGELHRYAAEAVVLATGVRKCILSFYKRKKLKCFSNLPSV